MISTLLFLWAALHPQMFPFPGPKNAATYVNPRTIIQGCTGSAGGNVTSCAFGSNTTPGNTLYFCVGFDTLGGGGVTWSGDSGTFTTDPGNSSAINDHEWTNAVSNGYYVTCVYVLSAGGGTSSITATIGSSTLASTITGVEVHGVTAFDASDSGSIINSFGNLLSSQTATPANSNDMIIGVCLNASFDETLTVGTNAAWSLVPNSNLIGDPPYTLLEWFTQPSAASIAAQCSMGGAQYWWAHVVAFH